MQVRLLGPVDVFIDGVPRLVLGRRRKALLAILALHDGAIVGTDWLVDVMYGEAASSGSVSTLQSHVSVLRGLLGSKTSILARPPGYALGHDGGDTDVRQAERLLRSGSDCSDPVAGMRDLEAGLALWRGQPLADVTGVAWLEEQAERLELLGGQVKRALSKARLAAGEHVQLIPDLELMAAEFPLDEQVSGQLMLALYRSGRQADALAVYHRLRSTLDQQLGIYPGPELRELEMSILRQDPALEASVKPTVTAVPISPPVAQVPVPAWAPGPPLPPPSTRPVPAQLPPAVPGFTGRTEELASLDSIAFEAAPDDAGQASAVPISVVSGTAGVGKTALAVHWAHRSAGHFPDGQLYVNLRGFDPGGASVEPAEAMRGFLDALGVPEARVPDGLDAQAAMYRSLLAGRRMLVVLDNARNEEQVRPLLPGAPGCLAVLTSRHNLAGLVAAEGARPLALDVLGREDAADLLAGRLGRSRVANEPEAVAQIIDRCAGLPLALAVVAARAAVRPGFSLTEVAADLALSAGALDPFDDDDAAIDVRGVLSWSYRALNDASARLFRGLWDENEAVQQLGLVAARRCGDAAGEAHALSGLASCYARSGRDREAQQAFSNALAAFEKIADHAGPGQIHSQLGWLAERRNRPAEMLDHCQRALELFRAAGHRSAEAVSLNDVGYSHAVLGDYRLGLDYCQRSLALLAEFGERSWEEAVWDSLGYIHHQLGHHSEAIICYERSVDLCRQLADRYNEAFSLDRLGDVELSAGDAAAACRTWTSALAILNEIDHPDTRLVRRKLMKHGLALGPARPLAIDVPGAAGRLSTAGA
ncbi:MAG TPA: BTAD domain-containing putative transcriptional regulator [Streptosporangiaceae bacterium]|nr:BTAD domain-containing putative transcriptional regulator [Streptosporangiaceae bacterium]